MRKRSKRNSKRKSNKEKKDLLQKNAVSIFFTVLVIGILVLSSPADAIQISVDGESTDSFSTSSTLAVASMNATIDIESGELLNIQNYSIMVTNSTGSAVVNCSIQPDGTEISGCTFINNTQVTYTANYSYGDLYGYGYASSGTNVVYASNSNQGYGYGPSSGVDDEIVLTFDWEFQKQIADAGAYSVNVKAVVLNDAETKTFTSETAKTVTIGATTLAQTVASSTNTTSSVNATMGGDNVAVAANTSYIDTSAMGNHSTYVKGFVGVSGNVTLNMSIGSPAFGITEDEVITSSNDKILLYFEINSTVDPDIGYADVYFSIPQAIIDSIDGTSVLSNIEAYVEHDDSTTARYSSTRMSALDSTTEYVFRVRVTKFSAFSIYYDAPASSSGGGGGSSAACASSWSCGEWGDCVEGKQTRTCTDIMNCSADKTEEMTCGVPQVPGEPSQASGSGQGGRSLQDTQGSRGISDKDTKTEKSSGSQEDDDTLLGLGVGSLMMLKIILIILAVVAVRHVKQHRTFSKLKQSLTDRKMSQKNK